MDINTTPLIDVMLVLLVMLIITIPIQLHAVNLEHAGRHAAADATSSRKRCRSTSTRRAWSIGRACRSTRADLEEKMRRVAAQPVQPEIHLRPNKDCQYAVFANVLSDDQALGPDQDGRHRQRAVRRMTRRDGYRRRIAHRPRRAAPSAGPSWSALHVLIVCWALVTGTARKGLELIKKPLEAAVIQEVHHSAAAAAAAAAAEEDRQAAEAAAHRRWRRPPPPFVPPPEVTPPPRHAPAIQSVQTPPPSAAGDRSAAATGAAGTSARPRRRRWASPARRR